MFRDIAVEKCICLICLIEASFHVSMMSLCKTSMVAYRFNSFVTFVKQKFENCNWYTWTLLSLFGLYFSVTVILHVYDQIFSLFFISEVRNEVSILIVPMLILLMLYRKHTVQELCEVLKYLQDQTHNCQLFPTLFLLYRLIQMWNHILHSRVFVENF